MPAQLCSLLMEIINASFRKAHLNSLKNAIVHTVLMKPTLNPKDLSNFLFLVKIIEKVVTPKLQPHLICVNILDAPLRRVQTMVQNRICSNVTKR